MSVDSGGDDVGDKDAPECQWHLVAEPGDGADFTVKLSPTTPEKFAEERIAGSVDVDGVGDEAVARDSRLYVRSGSTLIDIYFRRSSVDDATVLATQKKVAGAVVQKLH
jgi:hypothetical protein